MMQERTVFRCIRLRHFADIRIALVLDDGVKVNYGKFGDLLDGVKAVMCGAGG
jgi:hypothetical protein